MVIKLNASSGRKTIQYLLIWVVIMETLISVLGMPNYLRYICDILLLFSLICARRLIYPAIREAGLKFAWIILVLLVIEVFISTMLNLSSIILFIWACRNTFRFYIIYLVIVTLYRTEDVYYFCSLIESVFWINAGMMILQFVFFGKKQDLLGGVFGIVEGSNGYTNLFFCLSSSYFIQKYMYRKMSLLKMFIALAITLTLAAISELKAFFIEFALIAALSSIVCRFTFRKFSVFLVVIVVTIIGLNILKHNFPEQYVYITNYTKFMDYSSGFQNLFGTRNVTRMTAFTYINDNFFGGSWFFRLLGLGFGHGETSQISLFNSDFFTQNGNTNYRAFSQSMMYLETGIIGLGLNILFLISVLINSLKSKKKSEHAMIHSWIVVCCCISIFLIFYNNTLRSEPGYLMYSAIALGGAANKIDHRNSRLRSTH